MPRRKELTTDQWNQVLATRVRSAGQAGLPAGKLGTASERKKATFGESLASLIESGALIEIRQGAKSRFYHRDSPPPSPEEIYCDKVLHLLDNGSIWMESALVGSGKTATMRSGVLKQLVSKGRIELIEIIMSAKGKRGRAFQIATARLTVDDHESECTPSWSAVESDARLAASKRIDNSPSFEEVAASLGVSAASIQKAVMEAISRGHKIQLVPGEPREARDPEHAAIVWSGRRFYRFQFSE